MAKKASSSMAKSVGDKYKKLDHREHVLARPGMYIGSIQEDRVTTWIWEADTQRIVKKEVQFVPGLYKIADEILVNAVDHSTRLRQATPVPANLTKHIRVNIDRATGWIEVVNDGEGIEVEKHPEHGIYIPELIFGHMLTSTNYDDAEDVDRVVSGQNGIGAKACNVFSKRFVVETVDAVRKKLFVQEFSENMRDKTEPSIKACSKKPYTRIAFLPDYERFGMPSGLTEDMYGVLAKRVVDLCAVTPADVSVHLNGVKLDTKTFERYADLYLGARGEHERVHEQVNDRMEVIVSYHDHDDAHGLEHVSFVNGIWTFRGGKHVEAVAQLIATRLCEYMAKKKKDFPLKPQHVKNYLFVFVKSTIPNPTFDSQSKDTLTTPLSKFGFKLDISDKFIEKLSKTPLVTRALAMSEMTISKTVKKTDGKKSGTLRGITKLDDANWAGSAKSEQCVLILTEGDSAKSMAIAGLAEVGRDAYGVFPLKGKLLNVKDVSAKKLMENEEITHLKKILGLESGKTYDSVKDLRYGKILIMCDQDVDGSHIKGLLFNLFHTLWPSLIQKQGFLTSMMTPIVKARKGKEVVEFYNLSDFERWKTEGAGKQGTWEVKYYKGLGTSTATEARAYFKRLRVVDYVWDATSDGVLDLAFNKKRADDRKEWLGTYQRENVVDYDQRQVSYEEFVHKDLIHFSNYDLERSIPSMCDGLKVSQRKVLFGCFKRNLVKHEIRVAQLAAYVSEHSAYHHGEASLQGTIISLAQDFVGSNNIHLLNPNGQFGTRIQGGKDAASPRYIHTVLNELTPLLFRKEDLGVLDAHVDDGMAIEPYHYMPILPFVLVNGALGIGTGFSTNIPCYNPLDLVRQVRALLEDPDAELAPLKPWVRGFKGTIEIKEDDKMVSRGCFQRVAPTKVRITELPIGFWIDDFKELLETFLAQGKNALKSYESNYTDTRVDFTLVFQNKASVDEAMQIESNGYARLENEFKLVSAKGLGTTNMYLFNAQGQIEKYKTPNDIVRAYFAARMALYAKRKQHLLDKLHEELRVLSAKVRFIQDVVAGAIQVMNQGKEAIAEQLMERTYPQVDDGYDYLLRLPIYQLTRERKLELEAQERDTIATLARIRETTEAQFWSADLDAFEAAYAKTLST